MGVGEWKRVRLGEIMNHKKGFAFKSHDFQITGHPIVKVTNFTADSIDMNGCFFMDIKHVTKYKDYQIFCGDVIIATVGSWKNNPNSIVGKVVRVPKIANEALLNQNSVRLRVKEDFSQDFIFYRLKCQEFSEYLLAGSRGSANQASISLEDIFKYSFSLPPLQTQQRIASILSSLDDKIELNRQTNKTLEEMAGVLFREMCLCSTEDLAEGWRVGRLGEVCDTKGGTTPSTANEEYWNGEYNWATPKDLSNLVVPVLLSTSRKITEKGLKQISSGLLPVGTLLMSSRAPIGYFAISEMPIAINQGFIAINGTLVSNIFLYQWLKLNVETVKNMGNGSTFLEISKNVFKNIELNIPPKDVLQEFERLVNPIYRLVVTNEQEIQTLTTLRDNLLPKLMNGEIEV
jgi:type I restriction enzyme, S subunit